MRKMATRNIIMGALFVAMSVILSKFFGLTILGGAAKLSFGGIPVVLAGIMLGPIGGFVVGSVANFIGATLFPQGNIIIGIVFTAGLIGFIPGVLIRNEKNFTLGRLFVANLITYVVVTLGLNNYMLSIFLNKGFLVLLPGRAVTGAITLIINTIFVYKMGKSLRYYIFDRNNLKNIS